MVEPLIAKAVEIVSDRLTSFDVFQSLIRGDYTLWLAIENDVVVMAFVAEIIQHPLTRTVRIPFLGSIDHTISLWLEEGLKALEDYGRMNDCSAVELYGRQGWNKMISPFGYKVEASIYQKKIGYQDGQ